MCPPNVPPRQPAIRIAFEIAARTASPLAALIARARAYSALDAAVRRDLANKAGADDTARVCKIACVRERTLVLTAPDAAWATRARLAGPSWLTAARRHWPAPLERCTVRLVPDATTRGDPTPPKPPGVEARRHLARSAELQADPELAAILARLAAL